MADSDLTNYPDILGYITGGTRLNISVLQSALAVRPKVVRAGRPFEAILLLQNASDVDVDVTATLQLPEQDVKKKSKRFITKSGRLVVGLRPAEVGYVILPLSCLPDTAISDTYKVGMTVDVKPLGKPQRIRQVEGGGLVLLEYLSDETLSRLVELKKLSFSTVKRGLVGTVLEAPFSVMGGQIGQLVDLKPGWISLWKMSDYYKDERLLFQRYGEILETRVLPQLKRHKLFPALLRATQQRMKLAGQALKPAEAHYITKLLVTVLEMATPKEDTYDFLSDDGYNVALLLKKAPSASSGNLTMPSWCRGMLRAIDQNEHAADHAIQVLATTLYDELLRDATRFAFRAIKLVTGEDMGSDEDVDEYTERLIQMVKDGGKDLDFSYVYLPLVMGGVIVYDRAVMQEEKIGESLGEIAGTLQERQPGIDESSEAVFKMAEQIVDRAMQKFGYRAD